LKPSGDLDARDGSLLSDGLQNRAPILKPDLLWIGWTGHNLHSWGKEKKKKRPTNEKDPLTLSEQANSSTKTEENGNPGESKICQALIGYFLSETNWLQSITCLLSCQALLGIVSYGWFAARDRFTLLSKG
jgi:hypothetical protein